MNDPHAARQDTRKIILDLAEALWLGRGFNSFSYQHISRELGVKNAAIHYHYPRKTDLGVALIERYRRRFARFAEAQAGLDPREQLEQYFGLTDAYHDQDQRICPSGVLSSEYQTLPEEMQEAARAFVAEMRAWAVTIVREGRVRGVMQYPGSPEAMGELVFAALQGALQLARLDTAALPAVKQQVRCLLGFADAEPHHEEDHDNTKKSHEPHRRQDE